MTHPYPHLDLVKGTMPPGMLSREVYETVSLNAPGPRAGDLGPALEPANERQLLVPPPPHEIRTPAVIKYPKSNSMGIIPSGTNTEFDLGFSCRSIVVQNVSGNVFLYLPEEAIYVTGALTMFAQINMRSGHERLRFEWHTSFFNPANPGPPAAPVGWATVWFFDEWIL